MSAVAPILRREDLDHLAVGAALLGSGGGGEPFTFAHVLGHRLGERELTLLPPDQVGDLSLVPVGLVGAPHLLAEKIPGGAEFATAIEAVSRWSGRPAEGVMGLEVGGANTLSALIAALDTGLPFVDADLMGRALPRLDQLTWAAAGLPVTPAALVQANGQVVLIDRGTPAELERTVRTVAAQAGWVIIALVPTPASAGGAAASRGGVARALELGRAHGRLPNRPTREQAARLLGARVLAAGRVRDVDRARRSPGFGRGTITLVDADDGTVLRIETENESLLAVADGEVVASCPDLLCLLRAGTSAPVPIEEVRAGDDVLLLVLPGPSWWIESPHLSHVSPRAFGLDTDPVLVAGPASGPSAPERERAG